MTELLRRLVAWVGLWRQPRQARPSSTRYMNPAASSLRYPPLPAHRSPYRSDTFIDGTTTVAVRPYLVAHEQRQQCREPRALDGVEAA
ncbi:hypothetical protein ACIP6X_08470 [Streptomyces coeruleorubidus]|uniref:hypothetical protein n=1 Tax=Streptomyces coeruleorubidus TaxID=116188 RepID=UPI0037F43E44